MWLYPDDSTYTGFLTTCKLTKKEAQNADVEVFEGRGKLIDAHGKILFQGAWKNTAEVMKNDGSREIPLLWPKGQSPNGVTFFQGLVPKAKAGIKAAAAASKAKPASSGGGGAGASGGRYASGGGASGGGYPDAAAAGDGKRKSLDQGGKDNKKQKKQQAGCGGGGGGGGYPCAGALAGALAGYASGGGASGMMKTSAAPSAAASSGDGKRKSINQEGKDNKKQKKQQPGVPAAESTIEAVQKAELAVGIAEAAEVKGTAALKRANEDKGKARQKVKEQDQVSSSSSSASASSSSASSSSSSSSRAVIAIDSTFRVVETTVNDEIETYSGQFRATGSDGSDGEGGGGVREGYGILEVISSERGRETYEGRFEINSFVSGKKTTVGEVVPHTVIIYPLTILTQFLTC